jgi:hypothetical protein
MSPAKYDLGDYKEVSERIVDFRQKYPDGSLQAEVIRWPGEGLAFIAVKAYAYRSKHDEHPGVGLAWEPFPGKTPYTRDSELQNAETSAWGRAIVAALASDTKQGIASADEIRARTSEPRSLRGAQRGSDEGAGAQAPPPASAPSPPSDAGADSAVENAHTFGEGVERAQSQEAPASDLLKQATELYGNEAKLVRAARMLWEVRSVADFDNAMLAELIAKKQAVSA